jgi:arsenate reductase-like glutaredoxin family protein
VTREPERLAEMLAHSQGLRKVPVIVRGGKVSIGFNGA